MRHVKQSRRQLYERLDRPALKPLPARPYEYAEWKQVGVNIDYHISFDDHFYSVPYILVGETLWCRSTQHTIELLLKGKRVTSHVRSFVKYEYSTHPEHRPASHRAHLEWTPSRLISRSAAFPDRPIGALHELHQVISSCLSSLLAELPEGERDATKSVIRRSGQISRTKTAR